MAESQMNFANEDLLGLPLELPGILEQRRIADFLDAETARIDRLIAMRERQRALLDERFAAFLRANVTGANIQASERTEIDWLGPVPDTWTNTTINRISRFVMGTTFPHEYQGERAGEYPFIKVSDFQFANETGHLDKAENWISREAARELRARVVPAGSVLYARVGAALLLNRRRITSRPSVIDDNVRAISFKLGDPRYWAYLLSLLDMGQLVNPGPVPSISESQVASVRVPCPPNRLQRKIADELEHVQRSLHKARGAIRAQHELLVERRQTLITAAVTGQFDVSTVSERGFTEGVLS